MKKKNLKRTVNLAIKVTPEERDLIRHYQEKSGMTSLRVYLLQMATRGAVIQLDMSEIRNCSRLLSSVGNNINQIARQVNVSGYANKDELQYIEKTLAEISEQQDKIIRWLARILE